MTPFLEGMLAGYGIAIPVGAIAILIVDMGLRRGFGLGFMAGAGAAAADFFYASLAALAGEALASALAPFALILRIASALVLLGLGGYGLWRVRQAGQAGRRQDTVPTTGNGRGHLRTFGQFLGLTLLNPLTVAYFGVLILGRNSGIMFTMADRAAFVIGAALASLSWQTLLAAIGALAKRHLSPRFHRYTSVTGNFVVMGLGLRIVAQVLAS